jgi:tetratricopeptide (TPR) repeat protein
MSPLPASLADDSAQAVENSVRQLIANGKSKVALDNAKQFHKAQQTAASECLLLDAYQARIQALLDQNLAGEAKALVDLVRERFPAAKMRLETVGVAAAARAGDLAELLRPLSDPELSAERRSAIEQIVQTQVTDLHALANCPALPPEHNLRQAAAALDRAFIAATSGPVTEEQIALPEVSHRSPLAPWKLLIRAIACFHRGEDAPCRDYLATIKRESVAARLIPAMREMLGEKAPTPLKPAERALLSQVTVSLAELRSALENADRAFTEEDEDGRIFKAVNVAVRECKRSAPDQLATLKQIVMARGSAMALDRKRLLASLDGAVREDATFLRMYARAMEISGDREDLIDACALWDEFRREALREGLFPAAGVEMAELYLHMADVLDGVPAQWLKQIQKSDQMGRKPASAEDRYFLFPEKLYARACVIDQQPEAFSRWLGWAARQSVTEAEKVAREWNRIRPQDIEPLLYLMKEAEKRNAFPSALSYLEKAERIDAVHSVVRAARLRLLAAAALRHLQQKKPHLAMEKIALMAALPQSQQGDRPALLAGLRALTCASSKDQAGATAAQQEMQRLLGGDLSARVLLFGIAAAAKQSDPILLPMPKLMSREERTAIPALIARTVAIAQDLGIQKFEVPTLYLKEAEAHFPSASGSLNVEQIRALGQLGAVTGNSKLAWAASGEGLKRGGPSEAFFLLMRARATPPGHEGRSLALAAAAAELGRFHRDPEAVDEAVEFLRNPSGGETPSLTLEKAREVVRRELASLAFPAGFKAGPDYRDLLPARLCQCADCRRERGEIPRIFDDDEFDDAEFDFDDESDDDGGLSDDEMWRMFKESAPKGIPPELERMLFEALKEALITGESPEEIMSRIFGSGGGGNKKKGRRS